MAIISSPLKHSRERLQKNLFKLKKFFFKNLRGFFCSLSLWTWWNFCARIGVTTSSSIKWNYLQKIKLKKVYSAFNLGTKGVVRRSISGGGLKWYVPKFWRLLWRYERKFFCTYIFIFSAPQAKSLRILEGRRPKNHFFRAAVENF